jgi:hypothetical protein
MHASITFTHELCTLPVASTAFLKNRSPLHTSRKQKQERYTQERSGMNTKWINGIEEERPIKTDEKRNAGDSGGDKKKTDRTIATKASTHKEGEKPINLDLMA